MFQFTGFPSMRYGLAHGWLESVQPGFPIQRSMDQGIFAPPHGFSQLITSFFGSQCQGIRPVLFLAWPSIYSVISFLNYYRMGNHTVIIKKRYIALYRFLIITVWFPIRFSVCFSDVWFLWKSFLKIILCMKFSRYILLLFDCFISHQKTKFLLSSDHW